MDQAKALIDVAKKAGADYVKFQTFKADKISSKLAKKATYQLEQSEEEDTQFSMLRRLELSDSDHALLKRHCEEVDIKFLSTGFDLESVDKLTKYDLDFFKIPSGEITNKPLIQQVASKGLPVILSTGMANLIEIRDALDVLLENGLNKKDITILHCNTQYPTPMVDVNLNAMLTIKNTFGVEVGYSDHTMGIEVPIAAVALGALVIEKHFTLDRSLPGPDHKASLEPEELISMVRSIRNIEQAMGSSNKEVSSSERPNMVVARKSIHLSNPVTEGQRVKKDDFIMLRPGDGLSPMNFEDYIGMFYNKSLDAGHKLELDDFKA
ncbi:N-acetylneuraminate synthase [Roseivirga sp. 4D4]|nr:N-acetylneuraminate synthase [Roseivirga sp. 4D4]